jgi:uncharacterized protein (DUF1330 family)
MTDVPVYMVVNLVVRDAEEYRLYVNGFFPLLKRHGGEFMTYDDRPLTLEGASPREGRMVIFRFPSEDHATRWYADPDYQSLSAHRRAGSHLEFLTLVHGMPPRE